MSHFYTFFSRKWNLVNSKWEDTQVNYVQNLRVLPFSNLPLAFSAEKGVFGLFTFISFCNLFLFCFYFAFFCFYFVFISLYFVFTLFLLCFYYCDFNLFLHNVRLWAVRWCYKAILKCAYVLLAPVDDESPSEEGARITAAISI